MDNKSYKLAIETGIGGGSLSVLKDGTVLDYRAADSSFAKADHLIKSISDLLKKNGIEKNDIKSISVSTYPGSHTGLKIGTSVAKGLRLAWNVELFGKNLFECIARELLPEAKSDVLIILPVSRTDFKWRVFSRIFLSPEFDIDKPSELWQENQKIRLETNPEVCAPVALINDLQFVQSKIGVSKDCRINDLGANLSRFLV